MTQPDASPQALFLSPPEQSLLIWVRSWIYLAAFVAWTTAAAIACTPTLLSRRSTMIAIRMWIRGIMFLARIVVGISCRVRGREHVPQGACIIAAQHQSSFETYRLFLELEHPVLILKRELTWIPIIGWYMMRAGLVSIDRSAGAGAMRKMLRSAHATLEAGYQVVVFPEGTRVPPGETRPYRPGIAALYAHCRVPLIPMALNSGRLWGKTRVLKIPGEITFQFLPALPAGLAKDQLLVELQGRLEGAVL